MRDPFCMASTCLEVCDYYTIVLGSISAHCLPYLAPWRPKLSPLGWFDIVLNIISLIELWHTWISLLISLFDIHASLYITLTDFSMFLLVWWIVGIFGCVSMIYVTPCVMLSCRSGNWLEKYIVRLSGFLLFMFDSIEQFMACLRVHIDIVW